MELMDELKKLYIQIDYYMDEAWVDCDDHYHNIFMNIDTDITNYIADIEDGLEINEEIVRMDINRAYRIIDNYIESNEC